MPGISIAVVDKEDPHKLLPQGEDGEICVSGPQVMKGYWRRDEETAATIVDGRLLTGDVGHIDADGYVFIIDRKKDLVLVSGFNVFPRKVEEGIYRHPAVEEVTVIGVPDDYTGEAVKALRQAQGRRGARSRRAQGLPRRQAWQARDAQVCRVPRRAAEDDDRQAVEEGAGRQGGGRQRIRLRLIADRSISAAPGGPRRPANATDRGPPHPLFLGNYIG